jgi:hypothetical protein
MRRPVSCCLLVGRPARAAEGWRRPAVASAYRSHFGKPPLTRKDARLSPPLSPSRTRSMIEFDPSVQNTAMWYLTPTQQLLESIALLLFLIPVTRLLAGVGRWTLSIPAMATHQTGDAMADGVLAASRASLFGGRFLGTIERAMVFLAWCLAPLTVYYKAFDGRLPYLLQPCHLLNFLICALSVAPTTTTKGGARWPAAAFYFYVCTIYGPLLAITSPDTAGLSQPGELLSFWTQHYVLVLLPLVWIARRKFNLFKGLRLTMWTWAVFFIMHVAVFLPASFLTGRNVNYMTVPPVPLEVRRGRRKRRSSSSSSKSNTALSSRRHLPPLHSPFSPFAALRRLLPPRHGRLLRPPRPHQPPHYRRGHRLPHGRARARQGRGGRPLRRGHRRRRPVRHRRRRPYAKDPPLHPLLLLLLLKAPFALRLALPVGPPRCSGAF